MPSESPNEGAFTTYNTNEEVTGSPQYISPVMDRNGVPYIPYRGSEFHGVQPETVPLIDDAEDLPDGTVITVPFTPPEEDLNPVPVRIVDTATHEYKQWRAWQAPVGNTSPVMVANRKEGQHTLKIRNCSTNNRVWIGPDSNLSVYTGYPLDGGGEATFSGEAQVYALADTGVSGLVTLAVLSEFGTAE